MAGEIGTANYSRHHTPSELYCQVLDKKGGVVIPYRSQSKRNDDHSSTKEKSHAIPTTARQENPQYEFNFEQDREQQGRHRRHPDPGRHRRRRHPGQQAQ